MTGTRSHTDLLRRLDWWRRQIQRRLKTNLTIAGFFRQLGVSLPTYHCWKRQVQTGPGPPWKPVAGLRPAMFRTTQPSCSALAAARRLSYNGTTDT